MSTPQVNPLSLSVEETAKLLSAVGGSGGRRITAEQVRADIDAGAPVHRNTTPGTSEGGDERINLVHYVAWLLREVQSK